MLKILANRPRTRRALKVTFLAFVGILIAFAIFVLFGNDIAITFENDMPSQSIGTTSDGSLINGKRLPTSGSNFKAYGWLPIALGRNTLHDAVRDTVVQAYKIAESTTPDTTFIYAECSRPNGGPMPPHKTHNNGLSIDFIVPVNKGGQPAILKTHPFNKYGYGLQFDKDGWNESQQYRIDFDALAAHLLAIADAAEAKGVKIQRVILHPELQILLFKTTKGPLVKQRIPFLNRPSWVRHDDHYHVDFSL